MRTRNVVTENPDISGINPGKNWIIAFVLADLLFFFQSLCI